MRDQKDTGAARPPLVVTLTLNPCIDRTLHVPQILPGGTNRVTDVRKDVSGKGINVSVALKHLRVDTVCLGFSYSEDAALVERSLNQQGISHDFVRVEGSLRVNIKLFDETKKTMTEFNERGQAVDPSAVRRLLEKLDGYLDRAALLVLSGSVPEGVPDDIYGTMIMMAHKKGVRTVLDASGVLLAEGLKAKPFLIKPNLDEFREAFGRELAAGKRAEEIARELVARGVGYVCLSMGAQGAMLAGAQGVWLADAPQVEVRGVQGAGDSLVAGICAAFTRGASGEELLRSAVAAAGGSLLRPGTQMCTLENYLALHPQIRIQSL